MIFHFLHNSLLIAGMYLFNTASDQGLPDLTGLFWTGVKGYRASYVTATNNEVYGLYAFDSTDGLMERSWASGSYDAGFYVGQCKPCDAVIDGVVSQDNGLGYSGTNAGGNLHIVRSVWRHNVAGIVPNTVDSELLPRRVPA